MSKRISRRRFVQVAAAGAAVGSLTRWSRITYAAGANDKLNIAVIGVTGQGDFSIGNLTSQNIVALCDVDDKHLAKAGEKLPHAKHHNDYRKMFDAMQNEVDAVVVATPDHHHAFATLGAIGLGKHVYCEKPLTHSVYECRQVMKAAARAKVATQMGTQIHAGENYRKVVELIQAGAIGPIRRVHTWVGGTFHGGERPKETPPVPSNLNWDLWLGPAPERPYYPKIYHPFLWRGWWDFGGGKLADMACHHMDLPHWALNLRHPASVEAEGPPDDPDSTPLWMRVHYHYAARGENPPVHLTWYHGDKKPAELTELKRTNWGDGNLFVGDKGMLLAGYDKHELLPTEQFKDYAAPSPTIPRSIGHHNEWVKACKEGTPTTCNFGYSGALTETVLLGNVAYRSGKKLEWNDSQQAIASTPEIEKYLRREYRKGWAL